MFEKKTVFVIHCSTGCTCCSSENHYRGFYASQADAQRRVDSFRSLDSKFWPVASQFAPHGCYTISEGTIEIVGDGRAIWGSRVVKFTGCVQVEENGYADENDEFLCDND